MVKEKDRRVVERFKNLMLERGVSLHSVVLFGSRARGDEDEDSDYDVLVVVECLDRAIRGIVSRYAWEVGFEDCLLLVPVVVTTDEIEKSPFRSSLLMQAVREEGTVI